MPLPALLLPFVNEKYAIKIFEDWIKIIGRDDEKEDIRIALVEGDVPGGGGIRILRSGWK